MIERREYEGEWWFLEQPEKRFQGKLTFTPEEGSFLEIVSFQSKTEFQEEPELILGASVDGKKITLYKCFQTNKKSHWGEINSDKITFFCSFGFIGTHFEKADQINFKEVSMRYSYLDEWVDQSGFELIHEFQEFEIKYKRPEPFLLEINENLKVQIGFEVSYPTFSHPQIEVSMVQKAWITFYPSAPKTLDEYLKIIFNMTNFLTLSMSVPAYPTLIEGRNESEKIIVGDKSILKPIDILFQQQSYVLKSVKSLHAREMLFTLKQISKKDVLQKWFERAQVLEPVYNLYFGTYYQRGYITNEFLNLTQALEAYHRNTMVNFELPLKEHNERINEILNSTSEAHKSWLSNKLKYSNEPTLRHRLRELWDKTPASISEKFGSKNSFVNMTVDTRNYWTHFGDDLKANAATGEELYYLVVKLRILIQTCLLQELGFSPSEVELLMSKPLQELTQRKQKP